MARRGGIVGRLLGAVIAPQPTGPLPPASERAQTIGKAVEVVANDLLAVGTEPVEMIAPLAVAAEVSAKPVAAAMGLDPGDELVIEELKRYLLTGLRELAYNTDREHFELWRKERSTLDS